jgi:hypothetical protein
MATLVEHFSWSKWRHPVEANEQGKVTAIFEMSSANCRDWTHRWQIDSNRDIATLKGEYINWPYEYGRHFKGYAIYEATVAAIPVAEGTSLTAGQYQRIDEAHHYVWPITSHTTESYPWTARILAVLFLGGAAVVAALSPGWHKLWAIAPGTVGFVFAIWARRGAKMTQTTTTNRWVRLNRGHMIALEQVPKNPKEYVPCSYDTVAPEPAIIIHSEVREMVRA